MFEAMWVVIGILFTLIVSFFIQRKVFIINRLFVMTITANKLSLESILFFQKKLNRIKVFDFISCLLFFYILTILLIYEYVNEVGGVIILSWDNEIQTLVLIAILMLLSIPWLLKYQNNQRYKKIYSHLHDPANFLNDPTCLDKVKINRCHKEKNEMLTNEIIK